MSTFDDSKSFTHWTEPIISSWEKSSNISFRNRFVERQKKEETKENVSFYFWQFAGVLSVSQPIPCRTTRSCKGNPVFCWLSLMSRRHSWDHGPYSQKRWPFGRPLVRSFWGYLDFAFESGKSMIACWFFSIIFISVPNLFFVQICCRWKIRSTPKGDMGRVRSLHASCSLVWWFSTYPYSLRCHVGLAPLDTRLGWKWLGSTKIQSFSAFGWNDETKPGGVFKTKPRIDHMVLGNYIYIYIYLKLNPKNHGISSH